MASGLHPIIDMGLKENTSMPSLEDLTKLIAESPNDPFPRYGLAMELRKRGRSYEAIEAFADLLKRFPVYIPGYHQYGLSLEAAGRDDEARDVYRKGISLAKKTGEGHAAEEMQAALERLV